MAIKISGNTVIENDESMNIGTFTSATRPASPVTGTTIYNTDISAYEYYDGSSWKTLSGGSGSEITVANTGGTLLHTLDNPNAYSTSVVDQFGQYVDISGNRAIVGAGERDAGGGSSGKAYIFDVNSGSLLHTLHNPTAYSTSSGDSFGDSVAISDNHAIVGAPNEDDAGGSDSGKAYIYDVNTGSLVHTLDNPNAFSTSLFDRFGNSVAISGNHAIVGARDEDDASGSGFFSGKAYIFDVESGTLLHILDNPNAYSTGADDAFGTDVAISENHAIVGAIGEDPAAGGGVAYIFDVGSGMLLHTLVNPNAYGTGTGDTFGFSVSISGNHAIVGAYNEDDAGGSSSGKAYIFDVTTGSLLHTLDNPNAYSTSALDYFGFSVAISGNRAIVGAYQESDPGGSFRSGKAYIFDVATGSLLHTLDNPTAYGTSSGDRFGFVAISGNHALVGAYEEDDAGGAASGKAYIFSVDDELNIGGVQEIEFANGRTLSMNHKAFQTAHAEGELNHVIYNPTPFSTGTGDFFGFSIAISGNHSIVGAYQEDDAGGSNSGKAYIFDVTSRTLLHTLDNPNAYNVGFGDVFGYSVAISGNHAIVGAYAEDDASGSTSGKAYIFHVTSGALLHTLDNPNAYSTSADDRFGYSVAISGNHAIVGAYLEDDLNTFNTGKAYIFDVNTGTLLHTLDNPNAYGNLLNESFGRSVAISGNHAVVSAPGEDDSGGSSSGKAYIFDVNTGSLLHTLDNPNAYSTSALDDFGYAVAISGNRVIVGVYEEDDAGGARSGKAYIFDVTTGSLLHTLDNPNAYSTSAGDRFGFSVAISGNRAIVGADEEDDAGGFTSGKAYIFDVESGTLLQILSNPNAYSTSSLDRFGYSVAISDNYVIVGAYDEDDAGGSSSGAAYIFAARDLTYLDKIYTLVS